MEEQLQGIVDKLKGLPVDQVLLIIADLLPLLGEQELGMVMENTGKLLGLGAEGDAPVDPALAAQEGPVEPTPAGEEIPEEDRQRLVDKMFM